MDDRIFMSCLSRRLPENQVCEAIAVESAKRSATALLVVDKTHPFFFDHKLDHIPGLLLAEGMHQLAETLAHYYNNSNHNHTCLIHIEFERFCHFLSPVRLIAKAIESKDNKTTISVSAEQKGKIRNRAKFVFEPAIPKDAAFNPSQESGFVAESPCPQEMINKHNPNNVMISHPEEKRGALYAAIKKPSPLNLLGDHADGAYHPLYILEAFMQTQRYLNSRNADSSQNKRIRDILRSVDILLQRTLYQTENLSLLAPQDSSKQQEHGVTDLVRKATILSNDDPIGECCIRTLCFDRNGRGSQSKRCEKKQHSLLESD